jgi:large repetitive protein
MRLIGSKSSSDAGGAHGASGEQNRRRRLAGRRSLALLASLTLLLLAGVSLAVAGAFAPLVHPSPPAPPSPPQPPTPTITASPADPTSQTSAHFTYADAQSGVSYQCQLDGGAFGTCAASGTTYGSLGERSHNFKVRAIAGSKTSSTASYSWTIDRTPPSATVDSPRNGETLAAADWGTRCHDRATICGEAKDDSGVSAVTISVQRDGGRWWGGSAFDQTGESFRTTTLDTRGHDSVRWSYSLPLPADGSFTVHVRASDSAGNTTSSAAQTIAHFAIDTTPPPVPTIGTHPPASTTVKSASFGFSDGEHGVTLLCRRDGARFERCTSPTSYGSLSLGAHTFQVQARDAVGNTSAAATYSWTIVKEVVETAGKPFTVAGNASGPLAPGLTRSLTLTLSNPNNVAITVTALSASVAAGSSNAGCDGPTNLQLTQSNISAANPLAVPANGHVTLPSSAVSAPQVLMKDLPVNQDACKGASFTFTYSGSAHS